MVKLTEKEVNDIKGMCNYWQEVKRRDDKSPLLFELGSIVDMLGTRILWIVADFARRQEEMENRAG